MALANLFWLAREPENPTPAARRRKPFPKIVNSFEIAYAELFGPIFRHIIPPVIFGAER
ncbi:hypothetical protein [Paraburkholderia phenoliruptrix]|uniref:hypothetical protein n=1 Tax=Paraburkholderia phenoliruptrix TaxID=252970 RepID=UPI0028667571|nr:hypothetical protein [Paraburkholderia phenoliruptrix]MDR6393530.1 hypothetical protein [Paraburkholderia phenoliruptrix]